MEVDLEDVRAEVLELFLRYEAALVVGDASVVNDLFWDSPLTLRYGIADRQFGIDELIEWRNSQGSLPPGRTLIDTVVTTFGRNTAVVNTVFRYPNATRHGRQSQTWIRLGSGWKIVCAHVSQVDD